MKIFKWYIQVPYRCAGFFCSATSGIHLIGITQHEYGLDPVFGGGDPVVYPGRSARFLVKELRRVGYNVSRRPWALYAFKQHLAARRVTKAADPWHK